MQFQAQVVPPVDKEYISLLLILLFSRYHKDHYIRFRKVRRYAIIKYYKIWES